MKKLFALARAVLPHAWYVGFRRAYRDRRTARITRKILEQRPAQVISGSFAGMPYVLEASFASYLPQLIGCYELELETVIKTVMATDYALIIDIGSAEGYYAVGLARSMPRVRVLAYDIDPAARELSANLARLNSVEDRVEIRTEATPAVLNDAVSGRCLVICDCEGYEEELINPTRFPKLAECDVLVEFHDFIRPGVGKRITERLAQTHVVEIIAAQPRTQEPAAAVAPFLSRAEAEFAGDEFRPPGMQWGWFRSKAIQPT